MPLRVASSSTQYVEAPVEATPNINPQADAVDFSFVPGTDTTVAPTVWHTGTWHLDGTEILAACLVGPANGGVVLAKGKYVAWVRITDNPEVPEIPFDVLTVF